MAHTRLLRVFQGFRQLSHVKYCHSEAKKQASVELVEQSLPKPKRFGQPVPLTHPHILKSGEVTPGITYDEYRTRRHNLMGTIKKEISKIEKTFDGHVVIIPSAVRRFMTEAIPYAFHQNTDFSYSCGFQEPNSVLVLVCTDSELSSVHRSVIFVEQSDVVSELWDGPRTGPNGAVELLGVDESLPIDRFHDFLMKFLHGKKNVSLWYDYDNVVNPKVSKAMETLHKNRANIFFQSPRHLIQKLRIRKSPAEISLMKRANAIASEAFVETIKFTEPEGSEHALQAKMEYECKIRGANYLAYPPVVASGSRATTIHYIQNDQCLSKGGMVLMDAGCYYHGYVSDITRTWPVSGKFSSHQKILYEALLEVQLQLLAQLNKSRSSLGQLYSIMCHLLGKKLQDIGVIPQTAQNNSLAMLAREFCPHHVGHYLGMDVHDCALIARSIELQPGTVITVEPGVYISEHNKNVPPEFRGLGIRIEDNVVITESGYFNLTQSCPKEVREFENLMSTIND